MILLNNKRKDADIYVTPSTPQSGVLKVENEAVAGFSDTFNTEKSSLQNINSSSSLNLKISFAFAFVILAVTAFWWIEMRPVAIKKECSWTLVTASGRQAEIEQEGTHWRAASQREYEQCIRHEGL